MRESSLGPHHLEVAASLNNLAVLLKTVGANEEAEALYTRSIKIKETVLGYNHPQVLFEAGNTTLVCAISEGTAIPKTKWCRTSGMILAVQQRKGANYVCTAWQS
jgi:hypothetical protein